MESDTPKATRFARKIAKKDIMDLPMRSFRGEIEVVNSADNLHELVDDLLMQEVIGFDTETRPSFKRGQVYKPSLIQLCTHEKAYLLQIQQIKDWSPLKEVFEEPDIVKAGVAIGRDLKELQEIVAFEPEGFVELSTYSDEVGIEANGLRPLTAIVLGFRISKGAQTSNWAKADLTQQQILYAATDAWVGREMYLSMTSVLQALAPKQDGSETAPVSVE